MPIFFRVPATKTCWWPKAVAYTAFARRYASNSASRCPSRYDTCPIQINVDAIWDASSCRRGRRDACVVEEFGLLDREDDDDSVEDPRDDDEDEDDTVNGIETC